MASAFPALRASVSDAIALVENFDDQDRLCEAELSLELAFSKRFENLYFVACRITGQKLSKKAVQFLAARMFVAGAIAAARKH